MERKESIIFNGVEYRLMGSGRYYLSQSTSNEKRRQAKGLHVAIWEDANGRKVPKGYCIHHIDGDTFNKDISNLECVPAKQHLSEHSKKNWQDPEYRKRMKGITEKRCSAAAKWHHSEEGKAWHKEHAKNQQVPLKDLICKNCGKIFQSKYKDSQFCSDSCGEKYRRKQPTYKGVCQNCGREFWYGKGKSSDPDRRFCSFSCRTIYSNLHRHKK